MHEQDAAAAPAGGERGVDLGCRLLKFFPAGAMGGAKMIKALHGPYAHRGVRFIPTGGVTAANLAEYLATPGVAAIGGSWLVAKPLLKARDWDQVTALTKEAVEVASNAG